MMTKTTLSDGRRTRPRFAAPTPTPPKFLIGTIEQSENHSTPSTQTTNANPNGHKSRFSRPPQRLAILEVSRPLSGLVPLAQPHPRKHLTPLPAAFLYRWPPAGVFEALATSRPSSGLVPIVYPERRRASPASRRAQTHSRDLDAPQRIAASVMSRRFSSLVPIACPEGRRALIHPRKLSGLSQSIRCTPPAQPHPRDVGSPWRNSSSAISRPRPLFGLIPLVYPEGRRAQPHPHNELGAPSRSAAKSRPPARCRRYKNPLALVHRASLWCRVCSKGMSGRRTLPYLLRWFTRATSRARTRALRHRQKRRQDASATKTHF